MDSTILVKDDFEGLRQRRSRRTRDRWSFHFCLPPLFLFFFQKRLDLLPGPQEHSQRADSVSEIPSRGAEMAARNEALRRRVHTAPRAYGGSVSPAKFHASHLMIS
jgi:hypothetical protein